MVCVNCHGTGDCSVCWGSGYIFGERNGREQRGWCPACWNPPKRQSTGRCPACHGLGEDLQVN